MLELVNFITTELHKSFSYLFKRNASEETKKFVTATCDKLDYIESDSARGRS